MTVTIDKNHVIAYQNNIIHLSAQRGSRLMGTVMNKDIVGKFGYFDLLAPSEAVKHTTRFGKTNIIDQEHSRRLVNLVEFDWGTFIDRIDTVRMIIDVQGPYVTNAVDALGRSKDTLIIAAATGNAIDVDAAEAQTNVALPAAQIIDKDVGGVASDLNIAKLIAAKRVFWDNDVDLDLPENRLVCVLNGSALESLLNTTDTTSSDFNTVRALVKGDLDQFMGMDFIKSNRLLDNAASEKQILIYAKSGIGLGIGMDMQVSIDRIPEQRNNILVQAAQQLDATRVEDKKVVSVECVQ